MEAKGSKFTAADVAEFKRKSRAGQIFIDNSYVIIPLTFVLVVIMIWCFYLNVLVNFMRRKKILWVEV